MTKIIVATGNENKMKEIRQIIKEMIFNLYLLKTRDFLMLKSLRMEIHLRKMPLLRQKR